MSAPGSAERAAALAAVFIAACEGELTALKPGNVHVHADGHGMTVADFRRSAAVSAAPLCRADARVGARIREAIAATQAAVGTNTNLGIVLLAAPILAAAERGGDLRRAVGAVLAELTVADAIDTYEAIRLARPAGLGAAAAQDVAGTPDVTLGEAMALAADRDRIARQYATGFADVFETGVAALAAALARGVAPDWATSIAYLRLLAAFPDSHVARKHGATAAEALRRDAEPLANALAAAADPAALSPDLLAFDAALKTRGVNPGTTADLTVASLLVSALRPIR
jgi:triphosphoribosyl-dephospho-CoA synthase